MYYVRLIMLIVLVYFPQASAYFSKGKQCGSFIYVFRCGGLVNLAIWVE